MIPVTTTWQVLTFCFVTWCYWVTQKLKVKVWFCWFWHKLSLFVTRQRKICLMKTTDVERRPGERRVRRQADETKSVSDWTSRRNKDDRYGSLRAKRTGSMWETLTLQYLLVYQKTRRTSGQSQPPLVTFISSRERIFAVSSIDLSFHRL